MKIIKVNANSVVEYESNNRFIPIMIGSEYNYYLTNDEQLSYEQVSNIPNLNNIVQGTLDGVIKYASYMSNVKIKDEITSFEKQLGESDYKILKMYEYSLAGKAAPYDITTLHSERQTLRDKINALQNQLKDVKTWEELSNIIVDNRKNI